ncbi:MAG: hypothetical protein IJK86_09710 [Lachnospiraceae bacterium]|nr:hypothetical protein [Lachnospiraceae bacterium]
MNDVMTRQEFAASDHVRNDFEINTDVGTFEAIVIMKAEAHEGALRVFLEFDDGRHIIAPVYWFQGYLGFRKIPNGSRVRISYMERARGVYPGKAELIE